MQGPHSSLLMTENEDNMGIVYRVTNLCSTTTRIQIYNLIPWFGCGIGACGIDRVVADKWVMHPWLEDVLCLPHSTTDTFSIVQPDKIQAYL